MCQHTIAQKAMCGVVQNQSMEKRSKVGSHVVVRLSDSGNLRSDKSKLPNLGMSTWAQRGYIGQIVVVH